MNLNTAIPIRLRKYEPQTIYSLWSGVLLSLVLAALALSLAFGLFFWVAAIGFPFELNYGEGGVLGGAVDILAGRSPYPPLGGPPYILQNYPPVFMAGAAGLSLLSDAPPLALGRLLSIASALFCAIACAAIVWRLAGEGVARGVRTLSAFTASLIFLGASPVILWSPLMRVDLLALAFSLAGLWAFAVSRYRPIWLLFACALFVLAGFTRPTTVGALVACCGVALLARPKAGLAMIAGCAITAILGVLALDAATNGQFSNHVIWANADAGWDWHRALKIIQGFAVKYPANVLLASGAALTVAYVSARAAMSAAPALSRLRPNPRFPQAAALGAAYFVVSAALALTGGKKGADFNYVLEAVSATAIMAGLAIPAVWRIVSSVPAERTQTNLRHLAVGAAGLVLSFAVIAQVFGAKKDIGKYRSSMARMSTTGKTFVDTQRVIEEIKRTSGDVLTEDRVLAVLGGKRIYFEFHDSSVLLNAGVIDPAPIVRKIAGREFPLIVVSHRAHEEIADESVGRSPRRLARALQRAIADAYVADESYASFVVYRPGPGSRPEPRP